MTANTATKSTRVLTASAATGRVGKRPLAPAALVVAVALAGLAGCSRDQADAIANGVDVSIPDGVGSSSVPQPTIPTTAEPLTVPPTTAAPSTAAPTTAAPSTAAPTAAPTTAAPKVVPTTAAPTTAAPTTAAPTTAAPTTAAPTTAAPTSSAMTLDQIRALIDPTNESASVEVVAWGDVDLDGDDDAIVLSSWCGASCGTELDLVLATTAGPVRFMNPEGSAFYPFYIGAGAGQSILSSASIDNSPEAWADWGGSLISLNGERLCEPEVVSEFNDCGPTERIYAYVNGAMDPIVG